MLLALIRKELLALSRDLHGLAALFLMPALFVVVMSLALQDVYRATPKPMAYAVQVQDNGRPAQALLRQWQQAHGTPQPLPPDVAAALRTGRLRYLLVLQPGLSAELARPSLPTRAFIRLEAEPGLEPQAFTMLQSQLLGMAGELKARLALAQEGLSPPPEATIGALLIAERHRGDGGPRPTSSQQNVPAWLVFGLFFVIASMSHLMVQERDSGTLARLRSLGVGDGTLLAAKALPYLLVNVLQATLMLALGAWGLPLLGGEALSLQGVHWVALTAAVLASGSAAVSMGLVLSALVRTTTQAFAIGPVLNVLMGALGGIMVPVFMMPAFMQHLAHWSPMNWALSALLAVLLRGADLTALLPSLWPLCGFSAAMALLAAMVMGATSR